MAINLSVKALLCWLNGTKVSDQPINIYDLQDGRLLLKVVHKLKKESSPYLCELSEDRLKLLTDFIERDCRFNADKGVSLSWDCIRNGINLTIEISKVLLLLVYHDMMNDRCTLDQLEPEVEREIANLAACYVMESDGSVYFSSGIDAYLARRNVPVPREAFKASATSSTSTLSTTSAVSSLSDDESPVFRHTPKVKFMDMEIVASSSVSASPLQDIMNTPKFQVRKMQRQLMKERDYRDGLERELASKVALVARRETHINQLQHCVDKLKEEQSEREHIAREQMNELETKSNMTQMRLNETLKENKDFKSTVSLMERKVDELTEENGALSAKMRAACSQLAVYEAEVGRLTENHTIAQEDWTSRKSHLETELFQATAQKELLSEQIQILQGKISCLEDEISNATKEDVGENMWPVVERKVLDNEIQNLKNELESTFSSLKKAQEEVLVKTQQLADNQRELNQQKELLQQQIFQMEERIQAKDENLARLQKELSGQREVLQKEINALKQQLEKVEQEKCEQNTRLQQLFATSAQEIAKLKELKKEKEDLCYEAEQKVGSLETELCRLSCIFDDKNKQINSLKEEIAALTEQTGKTTEQIKANEEMLTKLSMEKSTQEEISQNKIQALEVQVEDLVLSLKMAEHEIEARQSILTKTQEENKKHKETLHQKIVTCEDEVKRLTVELQLKNEQLDMLKNDSSRQSKQLQQEIKDLKIYIETLSDLLTKAEGKIQAQQILLKKLELLEKENQELKVSQIENEGLLLKAEDKVQILHKEAEDLLQQTETRVGHLQIQLHTLNSLSADKDREINDLKEEITTLKVLTGKTKDEIKVKEEKLSKVLLEKTEQEEVSQTKIQTLTVQVEDLISSLKKAEQDIEVKRNLLAKVQEDDKHKEKLQQQILTFEDEVKRLNLDIQVKNEQLDVLKTDGFRQCEVLHQEIRDLKTQIECLNESLRKAEEQVQAQQIVLSNQELLEKEIEGLKDSQSEKENLLLKAQDKVKILQKEAEDHLQQTEAKVGSLEAELYTLSSLSADKDHQIIALNEEITVLKELTGKTKDEIRVKEEKLSEVLLEKTEQEVVFQTKIQTLTIQVADLISSLKKAEQEIEVKQNLLAKVQEDDKEHKEKLQQQILTFEDEVKRLNLDIQVKNEQLDVLKTDDSRQCEVLQQEIRDLKTQIECLNESLRKAEEQVLAQQIVLGNQELLEKEIEGLKESQSEKDSLLLKAQDEVKILQKEAEDHLQQTEAKVGSLEAELYTLSSLSADKDHQINDLKEEITALKELTGKTKDEIKVKEEKLSNVLLEKAEQKEISQTKIQTLTVQVEDLISSLKKAEQDIEVKQNLLVKVQEDDKEHKEKLQQQMLTFEDEVKRLNLDIEVKNKQLDVMKTDGSRQCEVLQQEIRDLKTQIECLNESLRKAEQQVQAQQIVLKNQELLEKEIQGLKESRSPKESILVKTEEKVQILQSELSALNSLMVDKDHQLIILRDEVTVQSTLVDTAKEAEANERQLTKIKDDHSKEVETLQQEVQHLQKQVESISAKLMAEEKHLLTTQQTLTQQIDQRQQQLISAQELQLATQKEKQALLQEKEIFLARLLQVEQDQKALEKRLQAAASENDKLIHDKQEVERDNKISHKLQSALQQELALLKMEKEKFLEERGQAKEVQKKKREIEEQLSAQTQAAEHYKTQMEKAVNHYNTKKELLQESLNKVADLKHSLEAKEQEIKAAGMEIQLLKLDLDKVRSNEKTLVNKVTSLEAHLAFADHNLRAQNKIQGNEGCAQDPFFIGVPNIDLSAQVKRNVSTDSLEQNSLDDSLNTTRKLSAAESSTPLVRSSERLAAKRCGFRAESLETLYFTPINTRHSNRNTTHHRVELDTALKNPSSSIKRRRTTQVINITMIKKTPGFGEDESFHSVNSARSQPNLSSTQTAQPLKMELFETPGKLSGSASDQLLGLPGYRRSTIHSHTTSTFCVHGENEPDGSADDWKRIAEIQARNKTCLPHLKSSYPVESGTGLGSTFVFTDEDLRMGDPSETIRRASMMPGQLQDSLASHSLSLTVGQTGSRSTAVSNRLSLMPGQFPLNTGSTSHPMVSKGTKRSSSALSLPQNSPEKKVKPSCFPRPLTPKNKNVGTGPFGSQFHHITSPAERRQSVMFTVDNTPKSNNYLKKGLHKLRSSTRKSPGNSSRKSPAQAMNRKGNVTSGSSWTGTVRSHRASTSASVIKQSQVATRAQRKSPKVTSKTAKSPGLTASARKMISRMKI
ncbi:nuclear mitotic apparatus protein 1 [Thalassophryne amazonica]|uniref:nuclear mitotic apparatus protein 1 n=1 Tax=Thalassophryne amazonica TaxID=390379 RepID=UPI0014720F15|nr:nuclear mitotic apparatus protein 1 [Thalassophryne amazonica]